MIVYTRRMNTPASTVPQYFEEYRAELNFLPWLHDRRNPRLLALLGKKWFRSFLADVGASALNQMVYRRHIGPRSGIGGDDPNWTPIVDKLAELFDQRVQSLGFHKGTDAKAWREDHPGKSLVIVAGCQREAMYRRRARAAVRFVTTAELTGAEVIFSGANPIAMRRRLTGPAEEAQTTLEAAALREVFESELPRRTAKQLRLRLREESESANTKQNLVNSLDRLGTSVRSFKQLVVVSSSFHVPRLAIEVESVLKARKHRFESLTLVGSELAYSKSSGKPSVKWSKHYFKSACYEAYSLLFESHNTPTRLVEPPNR